MATRTRTSNRVEAAPTFQSKSDYARTLFRAVNPATGKNWTVADVARKVGIGYAFAYGIASRAGVAKTAANRRQTRTVSILDGVVTIQTTAGPVIVHPDGRIERKVTRTPKAKVLPKA